MTGLSQIRGGRLASGYKITGPRFNTWCWFCFLTLVFIEQWVGLTAINGEKACLVHCPQVAESVTWVAITHSLINLDYLNKGKMWLCPQNNIESETHRSRLLYIRGKRNQKYLVHLPYSPQKCVLTHTGHQDTKSNFLKYWTLTCIIYAGLCQTWHGRITFFFGGGVHLRIFRTWNNDWLVG